MAKKPDFLFNYYRPWEQDSSLLRSACDYMRDTSMAEYQADLIKESRQDQHSDIEYSYDLPQQSSSYNSYSADNNASDTYDTIRRLRSMNQTSYTPRKSTREKIYEIIDPIFDITDNRNSPLRLVTLLRDVHDAKMHPNIFLKLQHITIEDVDGVAMGYALIFYYIHKSSYKNTNDFSISFYRENKEICKFDNIITSSKYVKDGLYYSVVTVEVPAIKHLLDITDSDSFIATFDDVCIESRVMLEYIYALSLVYKIEGDRISDEKAETIYHALLNEINK